MANSLKNYSGNEITVTAACKFEECLCKMPEKVCKGKYFTNYCIYVIRSSPYFMKQKAEVFELTMSEKLVSLFDIHGNNINAIKTSNGQILVPLENIRETGFHLYESQEFDQTNIDKDRLKSVEFGLHLLQAAKEYFINNRVFSINETEILEKIKNCKELLSNHSTIQNGFENTTKTKSTGKNYKAHPVMSSTDNSSYKLSNSFNDNSFTKSNERKPSFSDTNSVKSNDKPHNRSNKFLPSVKLDEEGQMVKVIRHTNDFTWIQTLGISSVQNEINAVINNIKLESVENPKLFELYLAQQNGSWNRGKLINLEPLKVLFLDIGITKEVTDLCLMPQELLTIPCQSLKVHFENCSTRPQMKEIINVKPIRELRTGEQVLEIITDNKESNKPESAYFNVPKPLALIENEQIVIIVCEFNGSFALRTKECYRTLSEINKVLSELDTKSLKNAKKGQLVLCTKSNDKQLCRGVISNINGYMADVQFLDYYGSEKIPIRSLRNITENLTTYSKTYFTSPELSKLNKNVLGREAKALIDECIENKTKFVVELVNNYFDLKFLPDGPLLSEKLLEFDSPRQPKQQQQQPSNYVNEVKPVVKDNEKPIVKEEPKQIVTTSDKTFYNDMSFSKVEIGSDLYQCYYKNPTDVTLIATNEETISHMPEVILGDCPDNEAYEPQVREMCLGFYEEEWYRCVVEDIYGDKFLAVFVDYGNVEMLKSDQVRKFPKKLKNIPILGIKCKLVGLPNIKDRLPLLKELISSGDIITVDVKTMIKENEYEIELPEIYKKINESLKEC